MVLLRAPPAAGMVGYLYVWLVFSIRTGVRRSSRRRDCRTPTGRRLRRRRSRCPRCPGRRRTGPGRGPPGAPLTAAVAAVAGTGAGDPVDLGGRVPQRGADVVDLDLVDGPLLAFLGLVRPLPQPPGDDDPHPALQALGDVLRRLPPHVAGQEQAVTVLPLPGRVIPEPRRRGHPEPRHRLPGRGEPQLRIVDEIARDRDLGIACCHRGTPPAKDWLSGKRIGCLGKGLAVWETGSQVRKVPFSGGARAA